MRKRVRWGSAPVSVLVFGCCAIVAGCEARNETQDEGSATPEKVVEQPSRYIGQQVSLSGEVGELYEQRAFELEGTRPFFDDDVLVLAKSPVTFAIRWRILNWTLEWTLSIVTPPRTKTPAPASDA